tara:strand:- start:337 stop:564 length:228 start_codon:yes stop_codon:yes gene_type:complete
MTNINLRRYGDIDRVQDDVKALHDILNRQGVRLITDCLAESVGITSIKYNLSYDASKKALESIIDELKTQTFERI